MKHQCNAFCEGNRHTTIAYVDDTWRSRPPRQERTDYLFGLGARVVDILPAPEAPLIPQAAARGLTRAVLIVVEVPEGVTP